MNSRARGIQTQHAKRQTEQNNSNVQNSQGNLARGSKPLARVKVQPVNTGQTIAEPGSEQGTDKRVQVAEDGDSLGDDPGDDPAGHAESEPETDGLPVALVHQVGLGGEAEVDVLQANVAIDDACADDGGDRDAEGDLLHERAGGDQGGRLNVRADIVVDDDGGGEVQDDFKALKHEKGLLEILGGFHFGDEPEEGDVCAVGEDDVGDGLECGVQVCFDGGFDDAAGVLLHADGNHGDHDRAEDGEEGGEGDPGHASHGAGDGQDERDDHAD